MNNNAYLKSQTSTFVIDDPPIKIGRLPLVNKIVINHQSISKEHAMINYDSNSNVFYLIDLGSTNGTFINGRKIDCNIIEVIKENDVIRFGKDHTMYKFTIDSDRNDRKIALVNRSSYEKPKIDHFTREEGREYGNANEFDALKGNVASYKEEEFNVTKAKLSALMAHASKLQRRNDELERALKERDIMINILQSDKEFYNKELRRIKQCLYDKEIEKKIDVIIEEYLKTIENLRRINEEYKAQFEQSNKKWNDLIQENKILNGKIEEICNERNEENEYNINKLAQSEERYLDLLESYNAMFKSKATFRKKEAAEVLTQQAKKIMIEKNELLDENKQLKLQIANYEKETQREKEEIYSEKTDKDFVIINLGRENKKLKDKITELQSRYTPEKKAVYEKMISNLSEEISRKDIQLRQIEKNGYFINSETSNLNTQFNEILPTLHERQSTLGIIQSINQTLSNINIK